MISAEARGPLSIGDLEPGDVEAAIDLWRRCSLTRPWNDPNVDMEMAFAASNATVLAGRDRAALAATVMVGFDGHRGWVYYLAVHPDHRRRGYGRSMMAAAEAWLRERGAPKLQLMVREENAGAAGFYARLGFERQATTVLGKWLA